MTEEISMLPIVSVRNNINNSNLHNVDIENDNHCVNNINNNVVEKKSYIWTIIEYIIFENFVSKKITNYFNRKNKETTELSLV
jgi:hypothetical protein